MEIYGIFIILPIRDRLVGFILLVFNLLYTSQSFYIIIYNVFIYLMNSCVGKFAKTPDTEVE